MLFFNRSLLTYKYPDKSKIYVWYGNYKDIEVKFCLYINQRYADIIWGYMGLYCVYAISPFAQFPLYFTLPSGLYNMPSP